MVQTELTNVERKMTPLLNSSGQILDVHYKGVSKKEAHLGDEYTFELYTRFTVGLGTGNKKGDKGKAKGKGNGKEKGTTFPLFLFLLFLLFSSLFPLLTLSFLSFPFVVGLALPLTYSSLLLFSPITLSSLASVFLLRFNWRWSK
jgi:cellulose synthase/poly-beta-1,6-N-acetylglucosamine synthase-like glycosyltransferase